MVVPFIWEGVGVAVDVDAGDRVAVEVTVKVAVDVYVGMLVVGDAGVRIGIRVAVDGSMGAEVSCASSEVISTGST